MLLTRNQILKEQTETRIDYVAKAYVNRRVPRGVEDCKNVENIAVVSLVWIVWPQTYRMLQALGRKSDVAIVCDFCTSILTDLSETEHWKRIHSALHIKKALRKNVMGGAQTSSARDHGRPQKFFQRGAKPPTLKKVNTFSARRAKKWPFRRRRKRKFFRFFAPF